MTGKLTDAQKKDLMTGNSKILIAPQSDTLTSNTFEGASVLYTLKGTLSITENEPSKTPVQLDQNGGETIHNNYENGETVIKGSAPTAAMEAFDFFYNKTDTQPDVTTPISIDGMEYTKASAYSLEKRQIKASILITSQSKETAVAYMNVDMFAVFNWSNVTTTPTSLNFTATALGNGDNGDMIVLKSN